MTAVARKFDIVRELQNISDRLRFAELWTANRTFGPLAGWLPMTILSPWASSGTEPVQINLDQAGFVYMRGKITRSGTMNNLPAFVLPSDIRPKMIEYQQANGVRLSDGDAQSVPISINGVNGNVTPVTNGLTWGIDISLSPLNFRVALFD